MRVHSYATAGAAIRDVLEQPRILTANLKQAENQLENEFKKVEAEIRAINWQQIITTGGVYADLDELVDELYKTNDSFGQREISLGKKVTTKLPGFWQYINALLGYRSKNVANIAVTSKQLFLEHEKMSKYNTHLAVRAIVPQIITLVDVVREKTFESMDLATMMYFAVFRVASQSANINVREMAVKDGWFVYFSIVEVTKFSGADRLKVERLVDAIGTEFANRIEAFHTTLRKDEISLEDEIQAHWVSETFDVILAQNKDNAFETIVSYLPWLSAYLSQSQPARAVWIANLYLYGALLSEVFEEFLRPMRTIVTNNSKVNNTLTELVKTADTLGFTEITNLARERIESGIQYIEKQFEAEARKPQYELYIPKTAASIIGDLMVFGNTNQERLENFYKHLCGVANIVQLNDEYELIATNIEYHVLRAFYEKAGITTPIGNDDDVEELKKLVKKRDKLFNRVKITRTAITNLIREKWTSESAERFNILVKEFTDVIEEKIEKFEGDTKLTSKKVIKQMTKATKKLGNAVKIEKFFRRQIVDLVLSMYELDKTKESIVAMTKDIEKREVDDVKAGDDIRWYISGLTCLMMMGASGYLISENWSDILDFTTDSSASSGWWSYMPDFVQSFGSVTITDAISPKKWYELVQSTIGGSWQKKFGAYFMVSRMYPLAKFTAKTSLNTFNALWAVLNIPTATILEPLLRWRKVSMKQSFIRQRDIAKTLVGEGFAESMDMIREAMGVNLQRSAQIANAVGQTAIHTLAGNYAAAAGTITYSAMQSGPQLSFGLPSESQQQTLSTMENVNVVDGATIMNQFTNTIQSATNDRIRREVEQYRIDNRLKEEEEEEEILTITFEDVKRAAKIEEID